MLIREPRRVTGMVLILSLALLIACAGPSPAPAATPTSSPTVDYGLVPTPTRVLPPPPMPTSAFTPTLTATPIRPPAASFHTDVVVGDAPLKVNFSDTSQGVVTSWVWDFGDGHSSTEQNPYHVYATAGSHIVTLTVSGPGGSHVATMATAIMVSPGPLEHLNVSPSLLTLEPEQTTTLQIRAFDSFQNLIANVSTAWRVTPGTGVIDMAGNFKAGTKVGGYAKAITLQASFGGVTKQVTVDVTIVPGPVASVELTPGSPTLFTGDKVLLALDAFDQWGNSVELTATEWASTDGTIQGGLTTAILIASRQPGEVSVSVTASDGRSTSQASATIQVEQGYCETQRQAAQWRAQWYETTGADSRGQWLGEQLLPASIDLVTWGEVFGGRSGNIQMDAEMQIVVQRTGPVTFIVGGDDGFRLSLEGTLLIDEWRPGGMRTRSVTRLMQPGIYTLKLQYFEGVGEAILKFSADADVLEWTEATECFGGYAQPPFDRYFVYPASGESVAQIAQRFDVPVEKSGNLPGVLQGRVVIPGERTEFTAPKVIILQGIDSKSSCADATSESTSDTFFTRLSVLLRNIQVGEYAAFGRVSLIDASDVIGFSYSGQYQDCSTGMTYTETTYPVTPGTETSYQLAIRQIDEVVLPVYSSQDTCSGVNLGAGRLAQLIQRIVDESPDSPIVLIGHSMGGMVAAYYLSALAPQDALDRTQAVITVDSPLQGTTLSNPFSSCLSTDPAWQDIAGKTSVVSKIADLRTSPVLSRFFAINSTNVGDHVPGAYFWEAGCAGSGGLLTGLLGSLICPWCSLAFIIGGAAIDLQAGHSCAFYDDQSLDKISALVNGEAVEGFSRLTARIDNLDGIPRVVRAGSQGTMAFTFTNSGNVSWTFGALITTWRSSGITHDNFVAVTLGPGETRTVSFPVTWGPSGPRNIRVSVCRESSSATDCQIRLADTGWLSSYIIVQP